MEARCCLCGTTNKVKEFPYSKDVMVPVCEGCIADVVFKVYERRNKKWYRLPRINKGFWILIIGFILFLITWFVVKPSMGIK